MVSKKNSLFMKFLRPMKVPVPVAIVFTLFCAATYKNGDFKNFLPPSLFGKKSSKALAPLSAYGDSEDITGGIPPSPIYRRVGESFIAEYDPRTRTPKWVAEHITSSNIGRVVERDDHFYEESGIPDHLKAHLSAYSYSGYDRGHMAPAATHQQSESEMRSTFSLINICPQVGPGFNRDYWKYFESFVKSLTKSYEDVYVVTGPLFLPSYVQGSETSVKQKRQSNTPSSQSRYSSDEGSDQSEKYWESNSESEKKGSNGGSSPRRGQSNYVKPSQFEMRNSVIGSPLDFVHVPTHFFKVILAKNKKDQSIFSADHAIAAFIMPNEPIANNVDLKKFIVPVTAVEAASGLLFFSSHLDPTEKKAIDLRYSKSTKDDLLVKNLARIMFPGMKLRSLYEFPSVQKVFGYVEVPPTLPKLGNSLSSEVSDIIASSEPAHISKAGKLNLDVERDISLKMASLIETGHLCEQVKCTLPI